MGCALCLCHLQPHLILPTIRKNQDREVQIHCLRVHSSQEEELGFESCVAAGLSLLCCATALDPSHRQEMEA